MKEIRVSDIISQFTDYGDIPENILQNKADIGTRVHTAIDNYLNNDFYVLCERGKGYFESFLRWHETVNPVYTIQERRYYDLDLLKDYNCYLTGQVDGVFIANDELYLIDYKTSSQVNKITWPLQAHFYRHLLQKSGVNVKYMLFLRLSPQGKHPQPIRYEYDSQTMTYCYELALDYADKMVNVAQNIEI